MALTQEVQISKIEVSGPFNIISVLKNIITFDDGVETERTNHRHTVAPGADISGEDQSVQAKVAEVHTQEILDAYAAFIA